MIRPLRIAFVCLVIAIGISGFGCGGSGHAPSAQESLGAHGGKQDRPPDPPVAKKAAEEEKLPARFRK